MHLAWLYLLHAILISSGVDIRYRDPDRPHLLAKIDGEVKLWELSKCTKEHFGSNSSVKLNIDFFIALRNKIEHRHLTADENISMAVSGRSQALLLNFEKELVLQFGKQWTLASVLRTPIFVGSFTVDGEKTLLDLQQSLPPDLRRFLTKFDESVDQGVLDSPEFDIRIKVILQSVQRGSDALALKFVRFDDLNEEEKRAYAVLQRSGLVVTKDRHQSVANMDRMRPSSVLAAVMGEIPFIFNSSHHTLSWKRQKVRAESDAKDPRVTNQKFCIYDEAHGDYLYTQEWVDRIVAECQTAEGFYEFVGKTPILTALSRGNRDPF